MEESGTEYCTYSLEPVPAHCEKSLSICSRFEYQLCASKTRTNPNFISRDYYKELLFHNSSFRCPQPERMGTVKVMKIGERLGKWNRYFVLVLFLFLFLFYFCLFILMFPNLSMIIGL